MILALQLPLEADLSQFSDYLHTMGIAHDLSVSARSYRLQVTSEVDRLQVLELYHHFRVDGNLPKTVSQKPSKHLTWWQGVLQTPFILTIIIANLICFPVTSDINKGVFSTWLHLLTLLEFQRLGDQIYFADLAYSFETGQFWRLLTPMLLHFGWLHLVFNLLWVWDIGRRIERVNGVITILMLVVLSSISANLMQYWLVGASLFGGMSGVVFGLFGFAWVWGRLMPQQSLGVPQGVYIFMLVFLLIGFTGIFDLLGLGVLANGAHLGGLLAGIFLGGLTSLVTPYASNFILQDPD